MCLTVDSSLMNGSLPTEVPHPAGPRDTWGSSRRNPSEEELSCWTTALNPESRLSSQSLRVHGGNFQLSHTYMGDLLSPRNATRNLLAPLLLRWAALLCSSAHTEGTQDPAWWEMANMEPPLGDSRKWQSLWQPAHRPARPFRSLDLEQPCLLISPGTS